MSSSVRDHRVIAAFALPESAKAAMAALEREGVEAHAIRLLNDLRGVVAAETQRADERKVHWLARRAKKGALVGAVLGALLVAVGANILYGGLTLDVSVGAAIGGAAAGFFTGGFLSIAAQLPRNPDAWDTYLLAHQDEACVAVTLREEGRAMQAAEVLRRAGATSVVDIGRGGRV